MLVDEQRKTKQTMLNLWFREQTNHEKTNLLMPKIPITQGMCGLLEEGRAKINGELHG